jgi:tetratricopeptide (TPR) repeat protein
MMYFQWVQLIWRVKLLGLGLEQRAKGKGNSRVFLLFVMSALSVGGMPELALGNSPYQLHTQGSSNLAQFGAPANSGGIEPFTLEGRLDSNNRTQKNDKSYYKVHTFEGRAGEQITIDLTAAQSNSSPSSEQRESTEELLQLGIEQFHQYNLTEAEKTFQRVLALRQQQRDFLGQAAVLNHLGEVYNELNETTKALEVLQQALAIYQQFNNRQAQGEVLDNLGEAYWRLNESPKALETLQQALAIRRKFNDRNGEGESLNNIGVVYIYLGQFPQAVETLQQALAIRREVKDSFNEAETIAWLGLAHLSSGKSEQALELANQALKLSQQVKNPAV